MKLWRILFQEISRLGLTDLSLEWLIALTKNGEKVLGFEYKIASLLKKWIDIVLDRSVSDHPQATCILQFAQQLVRFPETNDYHV